MVTREISATRDFPASNKRLDLQFFGYEFGKIDHAELIGFAHNITGIFQHGDAVRAGGHQSVRA